MSASELIVVAFGLFIGYWLISKLMGGKDPSDASAPEPRSAGGEVPPQTRAWHEVLNVSPSASPEEIRAAYRSLMSQYHPDKVAGLGEGLRELAERKAKEINRAYEHAMAVRGGAA